MTAVKKRTWNQARNTLFFKRKFQLIQPEMWLWTRKATVSWLTLDWTFPNFFPRKLQFGLALGGQSPKCPRLRVLRDLRKKKILADNKLFNLLSFPVAIFCLKGGKKTQERERSKWEECDFILMGRHFADIKIPFVQFLKKRAFLNTE